MPTPSLKRSAARRKIKSIWLPADHSDERPFPDYPLHRVSLPCNSPSFSSSFRISLSLFLSLSVSLFRITSRSLTAPLNTETAIKAKKSNERLVFSAVPWWNEILPKSTKSRNDAIWKLSGMFYEEKPWKRGGRGIAENFTAAAPFRSVRARSDHIVAISTATLYALLCS